MRPAVRCPRRTETPAERSRTGTEFAPDSHPSRTADAKVRVSGSPPSHPQVLWNDSAVFRARRVTVRTSSPGPRARSGRGATGAEDMRAPALGDVFELFTMLCTPVDNLLHRCAPRRRPDPAVPHRQHAPALRHTPVPAGYSAPAPDTPQGGTRMRRSRCRPARRTEASIGCGGLRLRRRLRGAAGCGGRPSPGPAGNSQPPGSQPPPGADAPRRGGPAQASRLAPGRPSKAPEIARRPGPVKASASAPRARTSTNS